MEVAPDLRENGTKVKTVRTQTSRRRRSQPSPQANPSSHREAPTIPEGTTPDLTVPPLTTGATATPSRCPSHVAGRTPRTGAAGHAPPLPGAADRPQHQIQSVPAEDNRALPPEMVAPQPPRRARGPGHRPPNGPASLPPCPSAANRGVRPAQELHEERGKKWRAARVPAPRPARARHRR
ncbi:hypothetical protein ZWY2020_015472 [Hordeum vulgare]|nr:hypothetical protein ZWY2020_015472 [Hordeum vulgare]